VQQKIPLPEMTELLITPQLPEYPKIAHDVFMLLLDGKLRSRTEILKFLKPFAPPPPPPPPAPRRGRAAKGAAAAAPAAPAKAVKKGKGAALAAPAPVAPQAPPKTKAPEAPKAPKPDHKPVKTAAKPALKHAPPAPRKAVGKSKATKKKK